MTIDETKNILDEIKSLKRLCEYIKQEIESLYEQIPCPLDNLCGQGTQNSHIEHIILCIDRKRKKLEKLFKKYTDLENAVISEIETLTPTEQAIIIGYYMRGKNTFQLADEINYSRVTVCRIKSNAISKLARSLSDKKIRVS